MQINCSQHRDNIDVIDLCLLRKYKTTQAKLQHKITDVHRGAEKKENKKQPHALLFLRKLLESAHTEPLYLLKGSKLEICEFSHVLSMKQMHVCLLLSNIFFLCSCSVLCCYIVLYTLC